MNWLAQHPLRVVGANPRGEGFAHSLSAPGWAMATAVDGSRKQEGGFGLAPLPPRFEAALCTKSSP
jgi:hypothetical protein